MAKSENIFKRYELKYLVSKSQYDILREKLDKYTVADEYGESTILSLYYDTPDKVLIRRSIESPEYKEKLRLRSYGIAKDDTKVYIELKKKYDGIVYKRRVGMSNKEAVNYLAGKEHTAKDNQIVHELDYFLKYYKDIAPSMLLTYDRTALCGREDGSLRITFDRNIYYRETDLSLKSGIYGTGIIPADMYLMELKVAGAIPLWLVHMMNELGIYKTSFSKYGTAYKLSLMDAKERKKVCV